MTQWIECLICKKKLLVICVNMGAYLQFNMPVLLFFVLGLVMKRNLRAYFLNVRTCGKGNRMALFKETIIDFDFLRNRRLIDWINIDTSVRSI